MAQSYDLVQQIQKKIPSKITIDSLKVRIPLSEVEIIGENLGKIHAKVNIETGESFDEFKKNSEYYNYKGVSMHWRLEDQYDKGIVKSYLVLLINSKLLRQRYFEGIHRDNSKLLYDNVIQLGIVKFSYESFLKAQCTDVDFKEDFYCKIFNDVILKIKNISKLYVESKKGINLFKGKGNKGLEYGSRKTATPSYPYLKFYHKFIELVTNSTDFYNEYIKPLKLDIENLVRVEFTIKNKKHFSKYKIENTSFESILNLDQSTLEIIKNDILAVHLDKRVKIIEVKTKTTMKDNCTIQLMYWSIKSGMSYEQIRNSISVSNVKDKSQAKRKFYEYLDKLYKDHIEGLPEDKQSIEVDNFFNALGWS